MDVECEHEDQRKCDASAAKLEAEPDQKQSIASGLDPRCAPGERQHKGSEAEDRRADSRKAGGALKEAEPRDQEHGGAQGEELRIEHQVDALRRECTDQVVGRGVDVVQECVEIGRFRQALTMDQVSALNQTFGPYIERMGYQV